MNHEMKLDDITFKKVKSGKRCIELRLYDMKRKAVKVNDTITFTNTDSKDVLTITVTNIKRFKNFEELYNFYDKRMLGYLEDEEASYKDMYRYYTDEEINKYGVVAFSIKK